MMIHTIEVELDEITNHRVECDCGFREDGIEYRDQVIYWVSKHLMDVM